MKFIAFSPSGLSSIFASNIVDGNYFKTGAIGGGITLEKGVKVIVDVKESEDTKIETFLNDVRCDCFIAKKIALYLVKKTKKDFTVSINQLVDVPIGGGLGTSGASALATALALGRALRLRYTYDELARIAHRVEIENLTGLGTVSGLVVGGVVLVIEPGAPGYDRVERIVVDSSLRVVLGYYGSISKKSVLKGKDIAQINRYGIEAVKRVYEDPCIETFMEWSFWFAKNSGLLSNRVLKGIKKVIEAGAIAASQTMIGETVFSIVEEDNVDNVVEALKKTNADVIVSKISFCPARLL